MYEYLHLDKSRITMITHIHIIIRMLIHIHILTYDLIYIYIYTYLSIFRVVENHHEGLPEDDIPEPYIYIYT
jgi:hypothetical protein